MSESSRANLWLFIRRRSQEIFLAQVVLFGLSLGLAVAWIVSRAEHLEPYTIAFAALGGLITTLSSSLSPPVQALNLKQIQALVAASDSIRDWARPESGEWPRHATFAWDIGLRIKIKTGQSVAPYGSATCYYHGDQLFTADIVMPQADALRVAGKDNSITTLQYTLSQVPRGQHRGDVDVQLSESKVTVKNSSEVRTTPRY